MYFVIYVKLTTGYSYNFVIISVGTNGNWNAWDSSEGKRSVSDEIAKLSCWIVQTGKGSGRFFVCFSFLYVFFV